jgi:DNA-binding NtrC family response regulator
VLEKGEYQRLGETQSRQSKARIVAATNRDLRKLSHSGAFRLDLYHRLSVLAIETPPLRELGDDRWLLLDHFVQHYARELGLQPFRLDTGARQRWAGYHFPGNVRELRNIVIRLLAKHAGLQVDSLALAEELDEDDMPTPATPGPTRASDELEAAMQRLRSADDFQLDRWLADHERIHIDAALALADGNMTQAARLLGINRTTLYSRLESKRDKT